MDIGFDWASFIELPSFTTNWAAIGCTDQDLLALQLELLVDPTGWPVVPTAGGWRKARFAPPSTGGGRSGAVRVYYADLPEWGLIILGTAFTKSQMSDLSAKGKKLIGQTLAGIIHDLRESP